MFIEFSYAFSGKLLPRLRGCTVAGGAGSAGWAGRSSWGTAASIRHFLRSLSTFFFPALSPVVWPAALLLGLGGQPAGAQAPRWQAADFALPLSQVVSEPHQQWVSSGYTTVRPALRTVCGVGDFVSPPLLANGFSFGVSFRANGRAFSDKADNWGENSVYSQGSWQPDGIVRRGTYHRDQHGRLLSLGFRSDLVPLFGQAGFVVKLRVLNRADSMLTLRAAPTLDPGALLRVPLDQWGFFLPTGQATVQQVGPTEWTTAALRLRLYQRDSGAVRLLPHQAHTYYWAVVLRPLAEGAPQAVDFEQLIAQTRSAWQRRITTGLAAVPKLTSTIPGLADYYNRSLVSGLVCIWENPAFVINPYVATSGMDGGSMNCYLWDVGYVPNMLTMLLGPHAETLVRQLARVKLDQFYSFTPAGTGTGVPYSYSTYAFTNFVRTLANHRGVDPALYAEARRLVLAQEARPTWHGLLDFGAQSNLLEMRNRGYEHYVASPNIERAWCLRALADLNDAQRGFATQSRAWRARADTITQAVRRELWDDKAGWFVSRYPDGRRETVYSIQLFDALAAGACTPAMKARMYRHLADGKFLFAYGASSVSAEDSLRYEYNDTDWGGSGAYTGDTPQLAQMLYQQQQPDRAWDVLRRQLWMGRQLPYFPQEQFVDKPGVPGHERANIVAGLAGAETILYQLVGFEPRLDGSLWLHPQPPRQGQLSLTDFRWKGQRFSIQLSRQSCRVEKNGRLLYSGAPKHVQLLAPAKPHG